MFIVAEAWQQIGREGRDKIRQDKTEVRERETTGGESTDARYNQVSGCHDKILQTSLGQG